MESNNRVEIIPTSYLTADITPIVLSETKRTKTVVECQQIDNKKEPKHKIKAKLVFKKATKNLVNADITKLSKKDIKSNEYIELQLDSEETFNLAKGLYEYYCLVQRTTTPYETKTYVKADKVDNNTLTKIIENPKLMEFIQELSEENLSSIEHNLNIFRLKNIRKDIEEHLSNKNESFWQDFFNKNSWILSQLFASPYIVMQSQVYVGGKGINDRGGRYPDYFMKNSKTENIAIIELKTPATKLIQTTEYRQGVYGLSKELTGAIAQILNQQNTAYKEFTNSIYNTKEKYEVLNFSCIIVAGNIGSLSSPEELKSFDLYRNELKNVKIVTFDEILCKINMLIQLLEQPDA